MKPIELTVGSTKREWTPLPSGPSYCIAGGIGTTSLCHEHFHWRQALRWGVLPWYLWYLALVPFYLRKPSHEHPLERPAYELQWQIQEKRKSGSSIEAELSSVGLA